MEYNVTVGTEYLILTLVRLVAPLSILRFSLLGILLSAYLDYIDWNYLGVSNDKEMLFYQNWDKFMDIFYLALAWIVSFSWKDKLARITSSALFIWRVFGIPAAFFIDRSLLILFPNVFEWFFIFYLFFVFLKKQKILFTSRKILFIVLISLTIPKLAQEYFMHVRREFPWKIFDISRELGLSKFLPSSIDWSFWIWIFIFLSLPLAALIYTLKYVPKRVS